MPSPGVRHHPDARLEKDAQGLWKTGPHNTAAQLALLSKGTLQGLPLGFSSVFLYLEHKSIWAGLFKLDQKIFQNLATASLPGTWFMGSARRINRTLSDLKGHSTFKRTARQVAVESISTTDGLASSSSGWTFMGQGCHFNARFQKHFVNLPLFVTWVSEATWIFSFLNTELKNQSPVCSPSMLE